MGETERPIEKIALDAAVRIVGGHFDVDADDRSDAWPYAELARELAEEFTAIIRRERATAYTAGRRALQEREADHG